MTDNNENLMEKDPITKKQNKVERPRMWKVIFMNDDFTEVSFVEEMLQKHFRHTYEEASAISHIIHTEGQGVAGTYQKEVAEQKAIDVINEAKAREFPLQVVIAPEAPENN